MIVSEADMYRVRTFLLFKIFKPKFSFCCSKETQFRRVMDQIMKISLTDEEINALAAKYDTKNNSSINYKQFCNTINISNYII
jgi:Ca2+-binding EF-hand superfamily protein